MVLDPDGIAHMVFTVADGDLKEGIYAANQISGPSSGPGGH